MAIMPAEVMRAVHEGIKDWIIVDPETGKRERLETRIMREFGKPEEWAEIFALKEST